MRKFLIYQCREKGVEQVVSRHHIAPIAICKEFKEIDLEQLRVLIGENIMDSRLESMKIEDRELIKRIIGEYTEGVYIRIIPIDENSSHT